MKRSLAIVMALLIFMSLAVIPASAAKSAETKITAKKGDEVIYSLNLTVPEEVVGCDLSIYYDSEQFKPLASADFTGSFDEKKHQAMMNHNLKDEAICVFSIVSGIDFSEERSIFSVKLQAKKDVKDAHISYYVRYLYPDSLEQFKDYKLTCTVKVNGKDVISEKAPELNVTDKQSQGEFVNSVTGNGKDANVNMAKDDVNTGDNGGANSENNKKPSNNKPNTDNKTNTDNKPNSNSGDKQQSNTDKNTAVKDDDKTTTVTPNGGADGPENVIVSSTPSQIDENTNDSNVFTSIWFWVVVGAVVVAVAAGVVIILKKKKDK